MRKTLLSFFALFVCATFLFANGQNSGQGQYTRIAIDVQEQVTPAPTTPSFLVRSTKTAPFNLYENFDGFADWTTDLTPWTTLQLTTGPTYSSSDYDFPGEGEAWAVKVFNPSQTTPPATDHPPVDGTKYAIFVQYTSLNDNKWLISPEVSINETSELSFYAKSITAQYGLERIRVLVSTTDNNTASFTPISAEPYIEVPTEWTKYEFDLSAYAGQTIYFAINYVSYDAFICMIDAIKLEAEEGDPEIGWANLQWPASGNIQTGADFNVYGKVWINGVTGGAAPAEGLQAWLGYSTENTNPDTWTNWITASHQGPDGSNDEFVTNLGAAISAEGTYYYAYRYKYLDQDYVYGGFQGGFWDGTSNVSGVLTVSDAAIATYNVTFKVDMTDAEGFDHNTHEVWITGDFLGWNEPQTGNSKQLTRVTDKSKNVIFEEGFEGDDFPPTGWLNIDGNSDGQLWFHYQIDGVAHSGQKCAASASWTSTTGPITPDNWLVTPAIQVLNDTYELEFYVGAQDPAWPQEKYGVFISTTGTDVANFTSVHEEVLTDGNWHNRTVSLAAYAGETIYIAFRHFDCNDWFYIKIDDVKVTGEEGVVEPTELVYAVTLPVEAGNIAYKFFSTHVDTGWDGGEWVGDPNRTATIGADVTLEHVWGQQPTSIDEIVLDFETKVFPNPVRNVLNITSEQYIDNLRLLDMSGRQVYGLNVNGFEATVDVRNMNQGLYILQLISGTQVKTHKIQVVR